MMFRNEFAFLSNMYPSPITLGSVTYTCAEAAFQAAKLEDRKARKMFAGLSGAEARALGRKVQLRPNWEQLKVDVMEWVLQEKFKQNPDLFRKLQETKGTELVEDNTWYDTFWGQFAGRGRNVLGKLLMIIRDGKPWEETKKELERQQHHEWVEVKDVPEKPRKTIEGHLKYYYYKAQNKDYGKSEFDYRIEKLKDRYTLTIDIGEDAYENEEIYEMDVDFNGKDMVFIEFNDD